MRYRIINIHARWLKQGILQGKQGILPFSMILSGKMNGISTSSVKNRTISKLQRLGTILYAGFFLSNVIKL
ncbi:hypothetical protein [Dyadobacter sediminis]|uniref:hypothetical protein n=1 Tax=Dyadobacter sediminis TaxID=1493691 RepID=UPI001E605A51|nr:hypothetical protein [Dyadobacter sediminis]